MTSSATRLAANQTTTRTARKRMAKRPAVRREARDRGLTGFQGRERVAIQAMLPGCSGHHVADVRSHGPLASHVILTTATGINDPGQITGVATR